MMMAFGSDSSFSMHSFTIRRATRIVDATRGMTAIDSIVVRRSTMLRVLMDMVDVRESGVGDRSRCLELRLPTPHSRLLILQQLLDPLPQFRLTRLRARDDCRRRVFQELLVQQFRVERGELLAAFFQLAFRALLLLLRNHLLGKLDRN